LTHQKNQESLIRAFSVFVKKHSDYKLIILGEGNLKNALLDLIKSLDVEGQIKLLGSKTDIVPYYLVSDYFVSSSIIEGFGLAHAEALYCGLPVLTTKTAGPDEFIKEGENGYFMGKSEDEIIIGLEKMLNFNTLKTRSDIQDSIKNFSIDNTFSSYKELIDNCLK
jgi:glycosyltransferase involved in cell wall biosynthesis